MEKMMLRFSIITSLFGFLTGTMFSGFASITGNLGYAGLLALMSLSSGAVAVYAAYRLEETIAFESKSE